jgi:hypothetical protein
MQLGLAALDALAADRRVLIVHPFADLAFLDALGQSGALDVTGDRVRSLRAVFGDLPPADLLERATKASFDEVFWNRHSRAFAAEWEGDGVDASLVDHDVLGELWTSSEPPTGTYTLLQHAWLAARRTPESARQDLDEPSARLPE